MSEKKLRRIAEREGYCIVKSDGRYTLIRNDANAIMYHFDGVTLEDIASFFK